jgi:hypothetical protein
MKKLIGAVVGVMFLSLIVVVVALASGGPPGGGFYTGQTLQNIGTATANVVVTAYDSASVATFSKSYTVAAGASISFNSGDITGLPTGFQGSAVVSSDQPLKAIVNVTNRQNGSYGIAGGTAAAQYRGVDSANTGTTLSFPLAKATFGIKNSAFYIQNAGSASATFAATFLMGTSLTDPAPVSYPYTSGSLAPGQMAVIVASDAGVPAGRIGSLTVTSAQPMAGTVLEYETSTSPAKILQGTIGFTPSDYDTRILFPVVKKQLSGRSTGLQVQNVTAGSVNVTMVYYGASGPCAGQVYTEPVRTLATKASTTYLDSALLPSGCLASGVATGTGNIAGVVNESFQPCTGTCVQRATIYSAFPANSATTKLVAPVYKEDFGSKRTGLSVQNVGNTTATATVVFQVGTTTYTYNNVSIPANGSFLLLDMSNAVAYPSANWSGGLAGTLPNSSLAAVTVTANQPIIGLANEAPTGALVQDNINYESFNVTP